MGDDGELVAAQARHQILAAHDVAQPLGDAEDQLVADVVADRFGAQVVARSVDPLLAGVYAGSAATIGLRSAAPGVAAQLDSGAASLTEAARTALPPASGGPVFRAVGGGYQRLVDELVRQGRAEVVQTAVTRLCRTEDGWHLVGAAGEVWRADAVALAVPAPQLAGVPISRADLARSGPTSAATKIAAAQVLEHGLRHLAWLAREDPVVIAVLNDGWKRALADYRPEPFRNIV